jgi:hypothetical protein
MRQTRKRSSDCVLKHCRALTRRKVKQQRAYQKELARRCPSRLSDMKYYKCSKFYDTSSYKKAYDEWDRCRRAHCVKKRRVLLAAIISTV